MTQFYTDIQDNEAASANRLLIALREQTATFLKQSFRLTEADQENWEHLQHCLDQIQEKVTDKNAEISMLTAEIYMASYMDDKSPLEEIAERVNTFRQPIIEVVTDVMRENRIDLDQHAIRESHSK